MEVAGGIADRPGTKKVGSLQSADLGSQLAKSVESRGLEPGGLFGGDGPAWESDPEQNGVFGDETAEHGHAGLNEVSGRVFGLGKASDGRGEHLEGSGAQGHEQAVPGSEQGINGARCCPDVTGETPDRDGFHAACSDRPLRRLQKRKGGLFVVLPWSSHA